MFETMTRMGASAAGAYKIDRSLRFNPGDSTYLTRTVSGAGTLNTMTFSFWVKRGASDAGAIYSSGVVNARGHIYFSSDQLYIQPYNDPGANKYVYTTALFRDYTAWYHVVIRLNGMTLSNIGTAITVWVNGVEQATTVGSAGSASENPRFNDDQVKDIGRFRPSGGYFSGYLAEYHFIDGTALAASSFGETDDDTGQWIPKKATGLTYGTNGFYLPFSDNSDTTATTLGKDSAGSNNYTPTNFSVTAGIGNDSFTDTPTNNFATLNLLAPSIPTITNGSLDYNTGTAADAKSTFGLTSGKWYAEFTCNGVGKGSWIGITNDPNERVDSTDTNTVFVVSSTDADYHPSSTAAVDTGGGWTTNDIIGIALDATSKTCDIYKNGSKIYGFTSFTVDGPYYFAFDRASSSGDSITHSINFGQRPFSHQVSTYNAVCSAKLTDPTIKKADKHFDTVLYTGNGTATTITGLNFAPNLVWIKGRSDVTNHRISDTLRGTGESLVANDNRAADTNVAGYNVSAFTSDGWTTTSGAGDTNTSGSTFVAWNWKGGTAQGSTATTGSGTAKTYTSNYNATAGFSITEYTGNGTAGHTIPHHLGVAPDVIMVKRTSDTEDWVIYCGGIEGTAGFYLKFETGGGSSAAAAFNSTNATSSVFTLGDNNVSNADGSTYIAYAFSSVAGYSKFGKYTGNGADDGPYVDLGFRPAMIFTKRLDGTSNWYSFDNKRETYNVRDYRLELQSTGVEYGPYDNRWDFLSNGMKLRSLNAGSNASGSPFLYMAWADLPGKYTNAV